MKKIKERSYEAWLHVGVWLILFTWPLIIFHSTTMPDFGRGYVRYLIYPVMAIGIFYLNYKVFIPRYLFPRKILKFCLLNLFSLMVSVVIMHLWQKFFIDYLFGVPKRMPDHLRVRTGFFMLQNFVNLVMVVACAVAVRMVGRWYKSEKLRLAVEKEKSEVELKNLRSQLQPHFLFNTLNNIYALITIDPEKAKTAVHDLGGLLRYVLKESNLDKVPLSDEINFVRNYIALMGLRLGAGMNLEVDFPPENEARSYNIPPLLFINLVENAFKYGVGTRSSDISIFLEVDPGARRLHFRCSNTLENRESGQVTGPDTGVGLQNLQRRLEYIYGQDFQFKAGIEEGRFVAELFIPVK